MLKKFENVGTILTRQQTKQIVGGGDVAMMALSSDLMGGNISLEPIDKIDAGSRVLTGWSLRNGKCYCDWHYTVICNTGKGEFDVCGLGCELENCC
jgi:hypothetical protein